MAAIGKKKTQERCRPLVANTAARPTIAQATAMDARTAVAVNLSSMLIAKRIAAWLHQNKVKACQPNQSVRRPFRWLPKITGKSLLLSKGATSLLPPRKLCIAPTSTSRTAAITNNVRLSSNHLCDSNSDNYYPLL